MRKLSEIINAEQALTLTTCVEEGNQGCNAPFCRDSQP